MLDAIARVIGGIMGQNESENTRADQINWGREQIQKQEQFAKEGLTWKIDDAFRNADRVHPIYSMGASGPTFSPVSMNFQSSNALGEAVAGAGQDISRAMFSTASAPVRELSLKLATAQVEGVQLDNDIKRAQLASEVGRLRQNATPPFPVPGDNWSLPGQAQSEYVKPKALEVAPGAASAPNMEGGSITDVGIARTKDGFAPVPSKDVKERIEDNLPQEWMHFYRNNILPSFGVNLSPPPFKAPEGKEWWFNTFRQEYQLWPKGSRPLAGHKLKGQ